MTRSLILGGARSGKSARALRAAEALNVRRIFIATAEARDDEMAARIAQHRAERESGWRTVEAPLDLVAALNAHAASGAVCLVDCLTLWLSNLMLAERDTEYEIAFLSDAIKRIEGSVILVSNEIGMGLVPETSLGRRFRDAQGRLNQKVAAVCDRVEFIAAGLPITLKG